ncbi:class I SAM-dependent methyltransferase [Myceligenerans crystallogenes]|uniref:Methyltransferase domain-containing protein n=1 Tax=Myceligenerans crystallogenes TaxID=316335 RepID=A0ABN2NHG2_9MICO
MVELRAKNQSDLDDFYLKGSAGKANLFEVWEDGGSRGDSVTPSTFSAEYRTWMVGRLVAELDRNGGGLLSLGCGNAAVEAEVVERGHHVFAIDAMPDAVMLARRKGVEAVCADIFQWQPEHPYSVIYIDGVLGHLHDKHLGLQPVLSRILSWLEPERNSRSGAATLVASNDAPNNGADIQKAPGVDGFHWLSGGYMRDQALMAGFADAATDDFRYRRPISGERMRAIMNGKIFRAGEGDTRGCS